MNFDYKCKQILNVTEFFVTDLTAMEDKDESLQVNTSGWYKIIEDSTIKKI